MAYSDRFEATEPARAAIDAHAGPLLLEFGAPWCGWCQGAQPHVAAAMQSHPDLAHIKVEDGPGRLLGRSFRIKLWPTLILLRDGQEVERLVRPPDAAGISAALARLSPGTP